MKSEEKIYKEYGDKVKKVRALVSELGNVFNNKDIRSINCDASTITISLFNNCFINIVDVANYRKGLFLDNGNLFFYDEGFKEITKFYNSEYANMKNYWLSKTLRFLSNDFKDNKEAYFLLTDYVMKKNFSEKNKMEIHPYNEFFLYGKDEAKFRYKRGQELKVPKEGLDVELTCVHSFLYENEYSRFFDSDSPKEGYQTDDGKVIFHNEYVKRTYHKDGVTCSLKKEIGKDNQYVYSCTNKKGFRYKLKKDDKRYYLEDKKGKIRISHPDLMMVIV